MLGNQLDNLNGGDKRDSIISFQSWVFGHGYNRMICKSPFCPWVDSRVSGPLHEMDPCMAFGLPETNIQARPHIITSPVLLPMCLWTEMSKVIFYDNSLKNDQGFIWRPFWRLAYSDSAAPGKAGDFQGWWARDTLCLNIESLSHWAVSALHLLAVVQQFGQLDLILCFLYIFL